MIHNNSLNERIHWKSSLDNLEKLNHEKSETSYLVDQYHDGITVPKYHNYFYIENVLHQLNNSERNFDSLDIAAVQKVIFIGYLLGNMSQDVDEALYQGAIKFIFAASNYLQVL